MYESEKGLEKRFLVYSNCTNAAIKDCNTFVIYMIILAH